MEITEIQGGEGERLEFKRGLSNDNAKWLKTVVAFANCRGGRIIFGVDNDLTVVGIGDDLFAVRDAISDAIANRIEPLPPINLAVTTLKGRPVIVLDVEQGRSCPYYLKSKGPRDGVYVRYDAMTRNADDATIRELTIDGSGESFDRVVCRGLQINEKDIANLCRKLTSVARRNARTDEQRRTVRPVTKAQLVKWGVLVERGERFVPTWGYALLSGKGRLSPLVKCAVFKGLDRDVFVDRRQFVCPVHEQVEKAIQYVLEKINMGARFHGAYREDVYELPPDAIRELIVNAIVHRSYVDGDASPITVALHPDRLEITSPGGLPRTMTLERMFQGYSTCRNKALAEAFAYMRLIENWGSGVRRVRAELAEVGLKTPEYTIWPNAVRVCLARSSPERDGGSKDVPINTDVPKKALKNVPKNADVPKKAPKNVPINTDVPTNVPITSRNRRVSGEELLEVVRQNPGINRIALAKTLGVSVKTIGRHAVLLKGRIRYVGSLKTGGYHIV